MGKCRDTNFELLENPPFSANFAPSVFHIFANLKDFLTQRLFESKKEVDGYIADLFESHFWDGKCLLANRRTKFIEVNRGFPENNFNF